MIFRFMHSVVKAVLVTTFLLTQSYADDAYLINEGTPYIPSCATSKINDFSDIFLYEGQESVITAPQGYYLLCDGRDDNSSCVLWCKEYYEGFANVSSVNKLVATIPEFSSIDRSITITPVTQSGGKTSIWVNGRHGFNVTVMGIGQVEDQIIGNEVTYIPFDTTIFNSAEVAVLPTITSSDESIIKVENYNNNFIKITPQTELDSEAYVTISSDILPLATKSFKVNIVNHQPPIISQIDDLTIAHKVTELLYKVSDVDSQVEITVSSSDESVATVEKLYGGKIRITPISPSSGW